MQSQSYIQAQADYQKAYRASPRYSQAMAASRASPRYSQALAKAVVTKRAARRDPCSAAALCLQSQNYIQAKANYQKAYRAYYMASPRYSQALAKAKDARADDRQAAYLEALARLAVCPEDILHYGGSESMDIMHDLIEDEELDEQFGEDTAIYFGTTSRRLPFEALRFLVQRWYRPKPGSPFRGNRAVLTKGRVEPPVVPGGSGSGVRAMCSLGLSWWTTSASSTRRSGSLRTWKMS